MSVMSGRRERPWRQGGGANALTGANDAAAVATLPVFYKLKQQRTERSGGNVPAQKRYGHFPTHIYASFIQKLITLVLGKLRPVGHMRPLGHFNLATSIY